ncbi:MAG: YXWGXW repeat-containing protein, partial [Deltaproteobacteria bacterium]|nr:YXWGXW repeat-containing protein [Deltaproteobacteria bacterium]
MKKKLFIAALAAASTVLAGCVVAPGPVYREPPPPRVEHPGYAPVAGYIWIGGYWSWTGHRHEWVPGYWDAPRPGYRWQPPRWERDGNSWRQYEG